MNMKQYRMERRMKVARKYGEYALNVVIVIVSVVFALLFVSVFMSAFPD